MHYFATKVMKHPFYSIRRKLMFGGVSDHFTKLGHVKRCEIYVSGLNVLFRCKEVVKHPFYSIRRKLMFGSVSEHFAKLHHVKRCEIFVSGHYFSVMKL
jgi:hypothetical protein